MYIYILHVNVTCIKHCTCSYFYPDKTLFVLHYYSDDGVVKVFYNSEYSFSQRLYGELDVDLTHITLPQPLESIVEQSGIYIRGALPPACFQAIMTLHEVSKNTKH